MDLPGVGCRGERAIGGEVRDVGTTVSEEHGDHVGGCVDRVHLAPVEAVAHRDEVVDRDRVARVGGVGPLRHRGAVGAREAAVAAKYFAWVATLPPAHQAWEKVLQENLGSFYLPGHQADKVAGKANAWDYVPDNPALPRVLLIGDSVSRGYTMATRAALGGRANVHRAPENCGGTARALTKLDVWLGEGKWDVIHFNFGIHDRATPEAD